jgi:hypothetical protein
MAGRELVHGDRSSGCKRAAGLDRPHQEVAIGRRMQLRRMLPPADALRDVAAVCERGRREEVRRGSRGIFEDAGRVVVHRSRRAMADGAAHDEVRVARRDHFRHSQQVGRAPDVVVPEIGDVAAAGATNAFVVGIRLPSRVLREIGPVHGIAEVRLQQLAGVVGAAVADHDDLVVSIRLRQHRAHGRDDPAR